MRILFVVFSDAGHLNAMLSVAQHLEARGHELTLVSVQEDVSARATRAGVRARCVAAVSAITVTREAAQRSVKLAQQIGNARWLKRWLTLSLVDAVPTVLERLETEIRDVAPDLVVCDAMAYAGAVAATRAGVPWVSLATTALSLAPPTDPLHTTLREIDPPRNAMMASLGAELSFHGIDVVSPRLNVSFVVEGLFPDTSSPFRFLGAAQPLTPLATEHAFPWDRLPDDGRPIVNVCFGSHLSPRPEIYPAICNALNADEAFFVVVLKDLIRDPIVELLPAHTLAVEYAPQLPLLERCSAMVHHGGANSVMECISRGVPMLCVPLGYDQPALAAATVRAGVGITMTQEEAVGPRARTALEELLAPDGPRQRAKALEATSGQGAARAADLIEQQR